MVPRWVMVMVNLAGGGDLQDKSYPTLLRLISGSIVGDSSYNKVTPRSQSEENRQTIPTFLSIAQEIGKNQGKTLDKNNM